MLVRFRSSTLAFITVLYILAGCGGPIRVSVYPDPPPDLGGYRTYSWMSRAPAVDQGRVGIASLDTRVRAAVDANLALKGYQQRPMSMPDFLIGYRVATQYKTTETFAEFYNYRQAGGNQAPQESFGRGFEEASLTIELMDPRTRQIFWRASAASVIGEQPTGDRVAEAVRLMLEKLPPAH